MNLPTIKKIDRRSALQKEIDEVLEKLSSLEPGTDTYDKTLAHYEKLVNLNDKVVARKHMSPDAKAGILANAIGICAVLYHEQAHVIATKAWGMIIRGRI